MMNRDDAPSGANPETEDNDPTCPVSAEALDDDDDDPGFEVIYDSTPGGPDAPESSEPAPPDPVAIAPPDAPAPGGTLPLLEAQLGVALEIMQDFAKWIIHHQNTDIHTCL